MRSCTGSMPADMSAYQPCSELSGDLGEERIHPAPRVIHEVSTRLAGQPADFVPPGVDTDDDVGMLLTYDRDEVSRTTELFGDVHVSAWSCLDAADVHDRRALFDDSSYRLEGRAVVEGCTAVVEGVRSAVDDCHDDQVVVLERTRAQAKRHSSSCRSVGEQRGTIGIVLLFEVIVAALVLFA